MMNTKSHITTLDITNLIEQLRKEQINTWFDLGLFIDRIRLREMQFTRAILLIIFMLCATPRRN